MQNDATPLGLKMKRQLAMVAHHVAQPIMVRRRAVGHQEAASAGANDPGVQSVRRIYAYYKRHGIKTEVMGASFRNVGEILELAGSDLLTISPALLEEMQKTSGTVARKLSPDTAAKLGREKIHLDEKAFRWLHNEDAMATEKLAEGIRLFAVDAGKLDNLIQEA